MNELVGREAEIKMLTKYETSGKPEFVAVYGRRRVGKTFLVKNLFEDKICFNASGTYQDAKETQLENFSLELSSRTGEKPAILKNWTEAFWQLEQYIRRLPKSRQRRIIFLDELPWFDTQKSGFVRALDYFWNHFLSERDDCMTNICEMKYDSQGQYAISNTEEEKLRRHMSSYRQETATRNGMIMTLITTYGLKNNAHSSVVDNVVKLDQLFL